MKISLNWIKEYVELPSDLSMKQLAHDLTMRTVEVEGYENPGEALENVCVARIEAVLPHPNADKLRICRLATSEGAAESEWTQVVCGGSNLYVGELVVLAKPGAVVHWHGEPEPVVIKSGKLRGERSEGMICAAEELGLETLFPSQGEHEILDLTPLSGGDLPELYPGQALAEALNFDDFILEIDNKSMTHRPDLWGHYGLARELAAIYRCPLKALPDFSLPEGLDPIAVEILATDRCKRYLAARFEGLTADASPYEMQKRLLHLGMRPINRIVDLSNYVMLATGQPCHCFDADRIEGTIEIRYARAGESIEMLDESTLDLGTDELLIADQTCPIALAGIMGGNAKSVFEDTKNVILEIACFTPREIRRSQQRHQLRTESSARFEKGIDSQRIDSCLAVFAAMSAELFPKQRLTAFRDVCVEATVAVVVEVERDFLERRSGKKIADEALETLLAPLGFLVEASSEADRVLYRITAPTYRSTGDIEGPYDILEEYARILGYENFHFEAPTISLESAVPKSWRDSERCLNEFLAYRAGFQEIYTYPWPKEESQLALGFDLQRGLRLEYPPAPNQAYLRQSLLPGLVEAAAENLKHHSQLRIFETSSVFERSDRSPEEGLEILPRERRMNAGLITCQASEAETVFRQLKGVFMGLAKQLGLSGLYFEAKERPSYADAQVWLNVLADGPNGRVELARLALLSARATRLLASKKHLAFVYEIELEKLFASETQSDYYHPVPSLDNLEEHFSIIVDEETCWSEIEAVLAPKVENLTYVESYRGEPIPAGKKAVYCRFELVQGEKTLTMEEVDAKLQSLMRRLEKQLSAEFRR
ncbi:MAG: phenylalanine--tRNA ligase subunit beta [Eubacteriales bacterium]|nr:phenylalanine--tRNA ligase subunit beta [Eubacteriales bacterium]